MRTNIILFRSALLVLNLMWFPIWVISRDAPLTIAGSSVVCVGTAVKIPITVNNFNNVSSISLRMDYNPQLMTYSSFSNVNSAFTDVIINDVTVSATLHKIIFVWLDVDPVSLASGAKMVDMNFVYLSGAATLVFNNTSNGGGDCEYADENGDPLNDLPTMAYYSDGLVSPAACKGLNINLFLEGLFNTGNGQMNKAKDYVGGLLQDKYPGSVADHISVELHDANTYSTIVYQFPDVELTQDGTATVFIPDQYVGEYYITVRHRNHIETVSAIAISFAGIDITYDFTTAAAKAYGNNQKLMATGEFVFFAGDVDQNGFIDINDAGPANTAIRLGTAGYSSADIDGNGFIDINDAGPLNTNVRLGHQRLIPN